MGSSAPASPTFYDAVTRLQALAEAEAATIYAINCRRAGWAVEFYEAARDPNSNKEMSQTWQDGLVTYRYYDSLQGAIEGETARLEAKWAARLDAAAAIMAANVAGPVDDKRAADGIR